MTEIVLSGLRPTGRVHLGNYFGAVKNWVDLQNSGRYRCFFFVADLHALTTDYADTQGLAANTRWYNVTIGFATLVGRFFMIIPMLAIAGSLGRKKRVPPSPGTFPVTTPLFSALLVGVIVIVGALTFFPALSLGPIVEHLLMAQGQVF